MPRRAARATPYTKVLSALLKPDLVRLCGEFRLAADGSVVNLRKRLKDYLNLNRDRVYRDPRYNALYPRHRRAGEPAAREPTPALSDRSFESWNGIEDQPQHDPQHEPLPIRSPTDSSSDNDNSIPHGSPLGSPQPDEHTPVLQAILADVAPPVVPQAAAPAVTPVTPLAKLSTSARKRPPRVLGLAGTNAAFLVPDHIRKKFIDGWTVHIPLTFLTDKGCLLKNKPLATSTQEILSMDPSSGQIITTSKPLSDSGELNLTFDEWHQAWRRLLDLIKTYVLLEFPLWEIHYTFILNNDNRAEMWPLYLAYDVEIRRRAIVSSIDPSVFSIGIWNDLEVRYNAKMVLAQVQSDLKQFTPSYNTAPSTTCEIL